MRTLTTSLLLLILSLCTACAGKVGASYVGELPPENTPAIIAAMTELLAEQYPPGQTTLFLEKADTKKVTPFDAAFEESLRNKGFQLTQARGEDTVTIRYTVDSIAHEKDEEEIFYMKLSLSDGRIFAQSFTAVGIPEAYITVLGAQE